MEEKPRRFVGLFISLHILHLCFSLALLVAVVHNQLANNARFDKLESHVFKIMTVKAGEYRDNGGKYADVDAGRFHNVVRRSYEINGTDGKDETGKQSNNPKIDESISYNYSSISRSNETFRNTSKFHEANLKNKSSNLKHNSSREGNSLSLNETSQTERSSGKASKNAVQLKSDTKELSESKIYPRNASCEGCFSTVKGFMENLDLVSCFDKLKVIVDAYMSEETQGNCQLFRQDTKGERGEKGCAGTSFAAPSFRPNTKRLVFIEGNTAVLTCTAVANPSAQITWYRGNEQINKQQDMTSSRYVIDNSDVTPPAPDRARYCPSEIPHPVIRSTLAIMISNGSDTGRYTCMANNILGSVKNHLDILIHVHVQLTTIPSNITVVQGENALLSCRASGVPHPQITWYRKDNGSMPLQHIVAMGDLNITNISKEEEGTFVCKAENVLDSRTVEAKITVNVFPEITSFADHVITVNENSTLILPCNATGYPVPMLRWTKRNDVLPRNRFYFDSQTLNITNVKYKDRGVYMCTADNTVGVVNKIVQVFVQVAPRIVKSPITTEFGYLTKTKRLVFKVFSIPEANITWTRPDWYRGIDNSRFRSENGSMVIENVQYKDSGRYQAIARNSLGEVRISTFLVVREAILPMIVAKPIKDVMPYTMGQTVSLSCSAFGLPTPTVTWLDKNGNEVSHGEKRKSTLIFNSFTATNRGRYTCKAQNDYGKDEASIYLIDNSVIRLSGSPSPYEGRVEVYHGGNWRTVCGSYVSSRHGEIACQQLGFSGLVSTSTNAKYGQGVGSIGRFDCYRYSRRLQDCSVDYYSYCGHGYDFGVKCH